jgi:acyl-CoA oxidase
MDPNLFEERKQPQFDPVEFQSIYYGSPEFVSELKKVFSIVAGNPSHANSPAIFSLTRPQQLEQAIKKMRTLTEEFEGLFIEDTLLKAEGTEAFGFPAPHGVHYSMFVESIMSLAGKEQREEWMDLIRRRVMLGTYAQTELGHGSNVRGLETTAEYDPLTQEFTVNSPTLTATKFWPGSLGTFANTVVLFAKLILNGKDFGIHPFLLPIRDLTTHQTLPGIEVGDIGPKFGYATMDNGFIVIHQAKIPLKNLLSRFGRVNPDGTYFTPPNARLRYFVMMVARANLMINFANSVAKGVTIAIRYSVVRGTLKYQAQQQKLFFALAGAVAMKILSRKVREEVFDARDNLEQIGEARLKLLHTNTSGLKALYSEALLDELEVCRQSCGGHGYSMFSGIPALYVKQAPSVTFEGDNSVMLLQCGNSLLKYIREALKGKVLPEDLEYLSATQLTWRCSVQEESDWADLARIEEALSVRATALARSVLETIAEAKKAGLSPLTISNEVAQKGTCDLALAHCELITFKSFKQSCDSHADTPLKSVLTNLARLYGLTLLKRNSLALYEVEYFSPSSEDLLDLYVARLLGEIRPAAVQLVDSFLYTDNALNSALGLYSGKVYETLFDWAQRYGTDTSSPLLKEFLTSRAKL